MAVARQSGGHARAAYEEASGAVPGASRLIVVVSCVMAIGALIYGLRMPRQPSGIALESTAFPTAAATLLVLPAGSSPSPVAPTAIPAATPLPSVSPSPAVPHIGIVAGHSGGNDTGAVCPDGLTEVEINLDVAQRVVYVLEALGYQADLLEEFDARLEGYRADALVSIHADSCEDFPNATPPASGFKVASVEDSRVPEAEDRLVACLAQCYAARTGMYFHANSITYDMTRYHTFYEIDSQTPGVIIETGFMHKDRDILTRRPDLVAQGIVDGIVCFLEGN
jgi:N-acetylmuramoyl-L-alanine amidase